MKITKEQLIKIIREEITHASIGGARSPEEVFKSADDSLNQAHKDLQMLSLHLKNAGSDVQEVEGILSEVERLILRLNDLTATDVAAISQGV